MDTLGATGNTSITIKFNVTAASSIEDKSIFLINATNSEASLNGNNQTSLTVYIDGVAPRLVELNISDGNTTWENGTFNGTIGSGFASFLSNDTDLTVTATVYEQTPDQAVAWLFYNASNIGFLGQQNLLPGKVELKSPTITVGALADVDATTHSHAIKYSWIITKNEVENFGVGTGNTSVAFLLLLNDTYNREIASNDSSLVNDNGPFSIILNNTLSFVYNITFTDGNGNVLAGGDQADASSDFLAATNVTIKIGVSGSPKPSSQELSNSSAIYIYYNTTGSMTSSTNGMITDYDTLINLTDANISAIDNTTGFIGSSEDVVSYQTSIDLGGNASNNVNVYVVLGNNTEDLTSPTETGAGNYTSEALFRFTVDGAEPSAELNTPTSRGLGTSDSIEYTCTGSDGQSGIAKYTWFLQKPGDAFTQISETTTSSGTNKQTFSGTNIGSAGTYNVRCRVTDAVGNSKDIDTTSLNQFTVSISSTGGGSAAVGGGGAGAAVSFDVDFTTSPQATFKASQGRVKSFSFDGTTKHTITFNEVTANSVTLIIASNPVTVLLNAGQSKSVDVNADGTDDMKVQLNGVDNGVADVTVTKLEEGAAKIKAEEEQARGTTETGEEGREVTPVSGRSLAWLWWTLIVIVAIVAIGYYVNKRK